MKGYLVAWARENSLIPGDPEDEALINAKMEHAKSTVDTLMSIYNANDPDSLEKIYSPTSVWFFKCFQPSIQYSVAFIYSTILIINN